MANLNFKKVGPTVTYLKAKDLEAGSIVINGDTYTGKKESTKFPGAFTHYFKSDEDETIGLSGTASLNRLMESVKEGDIVQVVYNGKITIESGPMKGKSAHGWDVLVADVA